MRIICPNCAAEYEVDDLAIPVEGRDVQCSNCGHGWYQFPPALAAALEADRRQDEAGQDAGRRNDIGRSDTGRAATEDGSPGEDAGEGTEGRVLPRRSLDAAVREVLRSEAQREAQARRAETGLLESQPELGLEAPARPATPPPPPGLPAADGQVAEPEEAARPAGRRKQLPDIDEIDPALATAARGPAIPSPAAYDDAILTDGADAAARRRGFRLGFASVVLLAVVAVGLYMVARTLPEAPGALGAYADWVDRVRLSLAGGLESMVQTLTAMMTSTDTPG